MSNKKLQKVLITGGAGYVGSVLVPKLVEKGYKVRVIDLYIYGENVLNGARVTGNIEEIKGDIRDKEIVEKCVSGCDAIIHLACISNDPSFELNPLLGKSINYDAFIHLVDIAKQMRIKRFIYASSSSVYGVKEESNVTEDLPLEPLTDYSKYKALCEEVLIKEATDDFVVSIIRPATVCGYSPRMRLDLTVNILTKLAVTEGVINVFGGEQLRPNLHINDMTDLYLYLLELPDEKIHKKIFNVGYENYKVKTIADMVRKIINPNIPVRTVFTDDKRSYHVSSEKIKRELGFVPKHSIEDAINDLKKAFEMGLIPNPVDDDKYYNIRTMQKIKLT